LRWEYPLFERFFRFLARDDAPDTADGATYAAATLAPPVRVLIRGDIFVPGEGQ
jgi:hypothetical protein